MERICGCKREIKHYSYTKLRVRRVHWIVIWEVWGREAGVILKHTHTYNVRINFENLIQ